MVRLSPCFWHLSRILRIVLICWHRGVHFRFCSCSVTNSCLNYARKLLTDLQKRVNASHLAWVWHRFGYRDLSPYTFLAEVFWSPCLGGSKYSFPTCFASWVLALGFDVTLAASRKVVVFCVYAESSWSLHLLSLVFRDMRQIDVLLRTHKSWDVLRTLINQMKMT